MNIILPKTINQSDLQNLFVSLEHPVQVSEPHSEENLTVVYAVSVPTVCRLCPLRKTD